MILHFLVDKNRKFKFFGGGVGGVNLPDFGGVGREFPSVLFKTICEVKSSENLLSCLYRKALSYAVRRWLTKLNNHLHNNPLLELTREEYKKLFF